MKEASRFLGVLAVCLLPTTVFAQAGIGHGTPPPISGGCGPPLLQTYGCAWVPWSPNNPNYISLTRGQVVGYIQVPSEQVVIDAYVPGPGSFSGEQQQQVVEIPGYVITETTKGYLYPPRWRLRQVNVGVYQWEVAPEEFVRK